MRSSFLLMFALLSIIVTSQVLTTMTTISDTISESSGIIIIDQRLITHNDSGGEAALFELDSLTGHILRKVVIANATNVDWEDICADDEHIYIGDFGNNSGDRTDLMIYRISILDYLTTSNDTVYADTIQFHYSDQVDFSPSPQATNFDAEALLSYNDSLYIFTKNWLNNRSNVYSIPTTPGIHQANKVDNLDPQGLVTGAVYEPISDKIMLVGYSQIFPFVVEIDQFGNGPFSSGNIYKYSVFPQASVQIESITPVGVDQFYITAEENFTGPALLYKLHNATVGISTTQYADLTVFPNPSTGFVQICTSLPNNGSATIKIIDLLGNVLLTEEHGTSGDYATYHVDLAGLPSGTYLLEFNNGRTSRTTKVVLD